MKGRSVPGFLLGVRAGSEKRRKGVFCGAGLEAIVGFSVVVEYVEVFGVLGRLSGFWGGGLDEFLAEVETEQGRGEAEGMRDGAVRQAEFGEGKDKRARIFDH